MIQIVACTINNNCNRSFSNIEKPATIGASNEGHFEDVESGQPFFSMEERSKEVRNSTKRSEEQYQKK